MLGGLVPFIGYENSILGRGAISYIRANVKKKFSYRLFKKKKEECY